MAYIQTIKLVKGDTLPVLYFTLRDSATAATGLTLDESDPTTWKPIDLTGSTVRLRLRKAGSTEVKEVITCSIADAAAGRVNMAWTSTALDEAGTFEGEIEITDSGGDIQTVYDLVRFKVRPEF